MNAPTRPVSSAKTGPVQAPTRMQVAAPENHVTNANAMPKKPNWASLSVTRLGIQIVAVAANTDINTPVITAGGTSTRPRTSPNIRNHAVNHHSAEVTATDAMAKSARPSPFPSASRSAPRMAMSARTSSSQLTPRRYAPEPLRGGRRHACR